MINGTSMRFSGDDYCYAEVLGKLGFWKTQWMSYVQPQAYNGNRYSLTLFSSISGLFGPTMNGALPALVIVSWLAGLTYTIRSAARMASLPIRFYEIILFSEIIIFFTLYTAPNLSQSLYWRSGMLPYLAPLATNTFLIGMIIGYTQKLQAGMWSLVLIGFTALLAGGFSEAAVVVQLGYLTLSFIAIFLFVNHKSEWKRSALKATLVGWGFSLIACLLLAFSPANTTYLSRMSRPDIFSFLSISINSGASFIYGSVTSLPLPNLVLLISSMGAFWLLFRRSGRPFQFSPRKWIANAVAGLFAGASLIIVNMTPSAYIQFPYPELRALLIPRFVMVLMIIFIGGLFSLILLKFAARFPSRFGYYQFAILGILGICCLYPIYSARNIYNQISIYQRWASYWDKRDEDIRQLKLGNNIDVQVMKIDHIIPSVSELTEQASFWYNRCAAGYYGVNSIRADQPGWDTP